MSLQDVTSHYQNLLARNYSWLFGGLESNIEKNLAFFTAHGLIPAAKHSRAVDLGAGPGFQSIPLARLGYAVTAIDISGELLAELKVNAKWLQITTVQDDLLNFQKYAENGLSLCVCMGDTLTHMETTEKVRQLFDMVYQSLATGGRLIIGFRDLTTELKGTDRIIPVRSSENKISTCFLEYDGPNVIVNDVIYEKDDANWKLMKSSYTKRRLGYDWTKEALTESGFKLEFAENTRGLITIIAIK